MDSYLREHHVTGLCEVDTRAITRMLRGQGTMNGLITTEETFDLQQKLDKLKAYRVQNTVEQVTRSTAQTYGEGIPVALMDFGAKQNMVRCLVARGCRVTVVPAHTTAEALLQGGYAGIMLSNGPATRQTVWTS